MVTLDISKSKNSAYFRCPDGTELKPFEFSNHSQGFLQLYNSMMFWKRSRGLSQVVVGFESTGPYAEPVIHFLKQKQVKLVQVNPVHTKRLKEVYDNSPLKSDSKDPKVIADLIELGRYLTVVIPEGNVAELRQLIHARERHIAARTVMVNQLQDLVYLLFPEFHRVIKNIQSKSAKYLLANFTSPHQIAELGVAQLTQKLRQVSRGRLNRQHAQTLYEFARESTGVTEGRDSIMQEIQEILQLISKRDAFVKAKELAISALLKEIHYSRYLLSIKGIGEVTVAGIIGEVADFSKFRFRGEIEKYAGLNLFEISSGKHQGHKHISKRGRPLMRKLLFFASLNMVKKNGIYHDKYQGYLKRGMPPKKALTAISRKILAVMFALVRQQCEFDINYLKEKEHSTKKAA